MSPVMQNHYGYCRCFR